MPVQNLIFVMVMASVEAHQWLALELLLVFLLNFVPRVFAVVKAPATKAVLVMMEMLVLRVNLALLASVMVVLLPATELSAMIPTLALSALFAMESLPNVLLVTLHRQILPVMTEMNAPKMMFVMESALTDALVLKKNALLQLTA